MAIRRRVIIGGAAVGAGQVVGQGLSFVRNIIIARIISPADFGIASTFAITVSLLEMISDLNTGTLLIQAPDGDQPQLQDTAHSLALVRGVINSVLLLLLAWPLSAIFGIPQARWAFGWLALYPLIRGVMHLDSVRMQREMRFMPSVGIEVASQLVTVLMAYPLATWLRDYSALLWLLLLQRAVMSVASFICAERPFRLGWDRRDVKRMFAFGWPLLINGVLMFAMMQGDRMVIGSSPRIFSRAKYTLTDLGIYSAAFTLAMVAVAGLTKITLSLMLPTLAQAHHDRPQFVRRYSMFAQALGVTGGFMAVLFVVLGHSLVVLIYGSNYAAAGAVIGWLGAMQSVRVIRTGPTMAALARGDTQNSLVSNVARSSGLMIAIVMAAFGAPLTWLAAGGFAAEVSALLVSAWRLRKAHGLPAGICLQPACLAGAGMAVGWLVMSAGADRFGLLGSSLTAAAIAGALLVVWIASLPPELRRIGLPWGNLLGRQMQ